MCIPSLTVSTLLTYVTFFSCISSITCRKINELTYAAKITDQDTVLTALASRIGDFLPYIGGASQAPLLLPLLEPLCSCEETAVRNAAAGSVSKILTFLSTGSTSSTGAGSHAVPHFESIMIYWSFLRNLGSVESGEVFYPRYSVACCLPAMYAAVNKCEGMPVPNVVAPVSSSPAKAPEPAADGEEGEGKTGPLAPETYDDVAALKLAIRKQYQALVLDEISIVRSAAVIVFANFVNVVEPEVIPGVILDILRAAIKDDCSPIRVRTIGHLPTFATKLKELGLKSVLAAEVLPLVRASATDPSWRIRLAIAQQYAPFATLFEPAEVTNELFPMLTQLVHDTEPQVRTAVLPHLLPFLNVTGSEVFLKAFIPVAQHLSEDPVPLVRKLLATLCVDVIAYVQGTGTHDALHDMVARLVSDEDPMIKLRVLKKLGLLARGAPSLCHRLTDAFKAMFTDSNWRVRAEMVSNMPDIIKHMGIEYFEEKFLAEFLGMLRDAVDEVRTVASTTLSLVVPLVGAQWAYEKIFRAVQSMSHADFLLRLSMLSSLQSFLESEVGDIIQSECLALVVAATNDKVPNVRLKAAQVLTKACSIVGPDISRDHIRPVLNDLQGDPDRDVAYFAARGMAICDLA
jgi:serine/threonine-protein phosphatase 2A regulatory subunit A